MSKKIKKKAKKAKKDVLAIVPIPIWCNRCNACVVALLALLFGLTMMGQIPGFGDTDTGLDDTNDSEPTTTDDHEPDPLYLLAIRILTWTEEPAVAPEDMTFEVFDVNGYSGAGSGIWYADLHLSMWGDAWTYSSESEHFVYGKAVVVDMFITPNHHTLTLADYLTTYVGAPEDTYSVYQNGIHALDISLKWVVA